MMGPANIVRPGVDVRVRKKDGTVKTEHIVSVGKTFGQGMVYGYLAPATSNKFFAPVKHKSINNTCDYCEDGISFGLTPGSRCPKCGGEVS